MSLIANLRVKASSTIYDDMMCEWLRREGRLEDDFIDYNFYEVNFLPNSLDAHFLLFHLLIE